MLFRSDQGLVPAQYILGVMYAKGGRVPKDEAEAAKWYRKAAEQGDAKAQDQLGDMYAGGEGVASDTAEAAKWYRKAADQGNAWAQKKLGVLYDCGNRPIKDEVEAYKWYLLSNAGGVDCTDEMDKIEQKLGPSKGTEVQRLAREWLPRKELPPK